MNYALGALYGALALGLIIGIATTPNVPAIYHSRNSTRRRDRNLVGYRMDHGDPRPRRTMTYTEWLKRPESARNAEAATVVMGWVVSRGKQYWLDA